MSETKEDTSTTTPATDDTQTKEKVDQTTTTTENKESTSTTTSTSADEGPSITFTINFKKQTIPVTIGANKTVGDLRQEVAKLTGVPAALQKLMLKGLIKNDSDTVTAVGLKDGAKVMLVGSSIQDVMATAAVDSKSSGLAPTDKTEKETLSDKLPHKKIIDKGLPEDVMPGILQCHDPLPEVPLQGILNNRGDKVRLTFKVSSQELWISSKTSTQKIPFPTIKGVTYEPIKLREEYSIVSLQLGNSEATKYHLYWVPSQYARAIFNTLMTDYGSF